MCMTDPIGDLLTRIRNGQQAGKSSIVCQFSSSKQNLLEVLKGEGYIRNYSVEEKENNKKDIVVELRYSDGQPVIKELTRISKPGRRIYAGAGEIPVVYNGLGISILSTNFGVISDVEARDKNVGGELLCRVF